MSDRRTASSEEVMMAWMRDISDRVDRLEHGGAIAGAVSFGSVIEIGGDIGGVLIEVIDTGGGGRDVIFTNQTNGTSYAISL
jgi:hypothetical protein